MQQLPSVSLARSQTAARARDPPHFRILCLGRKKLRGKEKEGRKKEGRLCTTFLKNLPTIPRLELSSSPAPGRAQNT
jgi:hypothetical protein